MLARERWGELEMARRPYFGENQASITARFYVGRISMRIPKLIHDVFGDSASYKMVKFDRDSLEYTYSITVELTESIRLERLYLYGWAKLITRYLRGEKITPGRPVPVFRAGITEMGDGNYRIQIHPDEDPALDIAVVAGPRGSRFTQVYFRSQSLVPAISEALGGAEKSSLRPAIRIAGMRPFEVMDIIENLESIDVVAV